MPIMTAAQARDLGLDVGGPLRSPRRSKYANRHTVGADGRTYASAAEARRANELLHWQAVGVVRLFVRQPQFLLGCAENVYRADFLVIYTPAAACGETVEVEDVKGVDTPAFRRWVRLWRRYGPCPLVVLRRKRGAWFCERIAAGKQSRHTQGDKYV